MNGLQDDGEMPVLAICGGGEGKLLPKHDSIADQLDMLILRPGFGIADGSESTVQPPAMILSPAAGQVLYASVAAVPRYIRHSRS